MKKVLSIMLVLVFCIALMSVAAFAELPTYTPADDGTYSIGYTEGTASNYYALLVVEGVYEEGATPVISEDTVLYIDQATADSNGDVSFDGWIPKNEEPATVYLGGTGVDTPVLLGYLGENTFIVSGTVTSESTYEATVTLTDAEGTVFTTTSESGAYSVEVPEGAYTFTVNVNNHLTYTKNDFAVTADTTKDVSVLGGDVNESGVVDEIDLNDILTAFTATSEELDISGDGVVNEIDLNTVYTNFSLTAVAE